MRFQTPVSLFECVLPTILSLFLWNAVLLKNLRILKNFMTSIPVLLSVFLFCFENEKKLTDIQNLMVKIRDRHLDQSLLN